MAVAKRDLAVGQYIDGIGGFDVFGKIYTLEGARSMNAVPIGVVQKAKVLRPVRKGEVLAYSDVELNKESFVVKLRDLQDALTVTGESVK